MSVATVHKDNSAMAGDGVTPAETVACVSAICLLASTPLLMAIALMAWGG
jgi:hypothetical protein